MSSTPASKEAAPVSNTKKAGTPMSRAQRATLRTLAGHRLFPGYCEIMADTGLKSYKAVDWVLDALERREYVAVDDAGDYMVTESGYAALHALSTQERGNG